MKTKQELYAARPTAPHLGIYRWQISSVLSIFHRLTGMALFGALSIITWWMTLWIMGGFESCCLECLGCNCLVKYALYALSFGVFYHTCTGIRHLMWDAGYGFSIKALHVSGWLAVIIAILLTTSFWLWII